jgi:hypothetical protein
MGFIKFIAAAYRESYARKALRVLLWVVDLAGVLSLAGITVVLFKVTDLPFWLPVAGLALAAGAAGALTLQGAYVLWFNLAEELKAARLAEVAASVEAIPQTDLSIDSLTITRSRGDALHVGKGAKVSMRKFTGEDIGGHGINLK